MSPDPLNTQHSTLNAQPRTPSIIRVRFRFGKAGDAACSRRARCGDRVGRGGLEHGLPAAEAPTRLGANARADSGSRSLATRRRRRRRRGLARARGRRARARRPRGPPGLRSLHARGGRRLARRRGSRAGRAGRRADRRRARRGSPVGPARGPCVRRPRVRGLRRGHSRRSRDVAGSRSAALGSRREGRRPSRLVSGLPGAGGGPGRPAGRSRDRPGRPPPGPAVRALAIPDARRRRGGRALRRRSGPGDPCGGSLRSGPPASRSGSAGPHTVPRGFRCERRGALRPGARNPRPAGVDRAARRGPRGPPPAGGDRLAHGPLRRPREELRRFAASREGRAGRDALERRESQSRDSGAGAPALLRDGLRPRGLPATLGGGQDGQRAAATGRPARRRGGDSRAGPVPSR